ncbi:MAG TPA: hypothetical protein VHE79_14440 [Spirochaetia bacterium]
MKYATVALEEVNALATESTRALGVKTATDVAILCMGSKDEGWGTQLDRVVSGCLVLGYNKIVVDLEKVSLTSSFQIACLVSAWHQLVVAGGTLVLSGMTADSLAELAKELDPVLFNMSRDIEEGIEWLVTAFEQDAGQNFPRFAKCEKCGAEGKVTRRGDHVCENCGTTYLVTERGDLPF